MRPHRDHGRTMRAARETAGLTIADVAARLGVARETVHDWEGGWYRPLPDRETEWSDALH